MRGSKGHRRGVHIEGMTVALVTFRAQEKPAEYERVVYEVEYPVYYWRMRTWMRGVYGRVKGTRKSSAYRRGDSDSPGNLPCSRKTCRK